MIILLGALCVLNALWMIWLCVRWPMPKIPGRLRVYRQDADGLGGLAAAVLLGGFLLWFTVMAAEAGVWFVCPVTLGAVMALNGLMSRSIVRSIAFSADELAVRGLFGPLRTYRWAEVSAYTVRREYTGRGRNVAFDMYRLTLPDRILEISGMEDSGRALLQVLERQRPDLPCMRLPE